MVPGLQNADHTVRNRRATRNHRKLALGELEALARALLSVLLALFHTGIARKKTVLPERWTQLGIKPRDRARQSHPYRAGLPANAAAMSGDDYIHLVPQAGELERLCGIVLPREIWKILFDGSLVHSEFAGACPEKN